MPCNGIAVMTAHVNVNLEEYLADPAHRAALEQWLEQQGVHTARWWPSREKSRQVWALGISDPYCGLRFVKSTIEISDEGAYQRYKTDVDRAAALATVFAGQLAQQQIVETFAKLGLPPQNLAADGNNGITFIVLAGVTIQVKVSAFGNLEFVTQEGDFATGKTTLEALVTALNANGLEVQPTGQVETHRHDLQIQYTGETTAQIAINAPVTETGPAHQH